MSRALRVLGAVVLTLACFSTGALPAVRASAASTKALSVLLEYPYGDPKVYLNDKTKKSAPAVYQGAVMTAELFKMFYKTHPGWTINPITTWGWGDPLRQKFLLSVAAGYAPDVMIGEDFIPEFAREGILEPINLGPLEKQLVPGPNSPGLYHGVRYAVSAQSGIFALLYNKTLMKQAGLDPNKPPTTWDEWLADSKKIAALGNGISGTLIEGNTGLGAAFRVAPFMRQLGGDFMDPTGAKITFDSPANVKALTFLRQLAATTATGLTSVTDEGKLYGYWTANKVGFLMDGPWATYPTVNFGIAALPLPAGGHQGNVIVGNILECVPKLAQHKQAALDFVRLLVTQQGSMDNYTHTGWMPTNEAVLQYVIRQGGPRAVFAKEMLNPSLTALPSYPKNPQAVWDAWYAAQLAAIATTKSIPDALAQAQSQAEALLAS